MIVAALLLVLAAALLAVRCARAANCQEQLRTVVETVQSGLVIRDRGQRLLVVDDEQAVNEVTHQVLVRAGYDVTSAIGGDGALRLVAGQSFDLVLLDVNMPAPDGWQTLHGLLKEDPRQRVLMVSGHALDEEACRRGARGLLLKPFDAQMLTDAVEGALAGA